MEEYYYWQGDNCCRVEIDKENGTITLVPVIGQINVNELYEYYNLK